MAGSYGNQLPFRSSQEAHKLKYGWEGLWGITRYVNYASWNSKGCRALCSGTGDKYQIHMSYYVTPTSLIHSENTDLLSVPVTSQHLYPLRASYLLFYLSVIVTFRNIFRAVSISSFSLNNEKVIKCHLLNKVFPKHPALCPVTIILPTNAFLETMCQAHLSHQKQSKLTN